MNQASLIYKMQNGAFTKIEWLFFLCLCFFSFSLWLFLLLSLALTPILKSLFL